MPNQIIDIVEMAMPGPMGDVTPEAIAAADRARDEADRAEDARDQAETFSATTVALQDAAVSSLLLDEGSATSDAVRAEVHESVGIRPTITAEWKTFTDADGAHRYIVYRTHAGRPVPGVLRKRYAFDFEKNLTPGVDPLNVPVVGGIAQLEDPESAAMRVGAPLLNNSSGRDDLNDWEVRGCQIKDGVLWGDFDPTMKTKAECIGFFADGSSRCYSSRAPENATGAQLIADGVIDTFGFGPNLVREGVGQQIAGDPFWGAGYNGELSARSIIGQTMDGDIVLINVEGKSGVYGIGGQSLVDIALAEHCWNAQNLDGGGSVQSIFNGVRGMFSTDASGTRKIADFLIIDAIPAHELEHTIVLEPNTGPLTGSLVFRKRGGDIQLTFNLTGTLGTGSTSIYTGLPRELLVALTESNTRGVVMFSGSLMGTVNINVGGNLSITNTSGVATVTNPSGTLLYKMRPGPGRWPDV